MQNISYMFFWNAYSLRNFMHFHPPVIQYHIVHLFNDFWCCCTFWTSFTWIIFKAGMATFKLGSPSSNTVSFTCSMISGVVALFGRLSRGSSSRLVRPRLNSAAHHPIPYHSLVQWFLVL
jgi:hypothetical protein